MVSIRRLKMFLPTVTLTLCLRPLHSKILTKLITWLISFSTIWLAMAMLTMGRMLRGDSPHRPKIWIRTRIMVRLSRTMTNKTRMMPGS
jgi:hypothetical protein